MTNCRFCESFGYRPDWSTNQTFDQRGVSVGFRQLGWNMGEPPPGWASDGWRRFGSPEGDVDRIVDLETGFEDDRDDLIYALCKRLRIAFEQGWTARGQTEESQAIAEDERRFPENECGLEHEFLDFQPIWSRPAIFQVDHDGGRYSLYYVRDRTIIWYFDLDASDPTSRVIRELQSVLQDEFYDWRVLGLWHDRKNLTMGFAIYPDAVVLGRHDDDLRTEVDLVEGRQKSDQVIDRWLGSLRRTVAKYAD